MFSSKSVGVLLKYSMYNQVIKFKDNKKLPFRLLYNLFEKEIGLLREYLNNIIQKDQIYYNTNLVDTLILII